MGDRIMPKYNMQSKYTHLVDEKYKAGWESIFGNKKQINTQQTNEESTNERKAAKTAGRKQQRNIRD